MADTLLLYRAELISSRDLNLTHSNHDDLRAPCTGFPLPLAYKRRTAEVDLHTRLSSPRSYRPCVKLHFYYLRLVIHSYVGVETTRLCPLKSRNSNSSSPQVSPSLQLDICALRLYLRLLGKLPLQSIHLPLPSQHTRLGRHPSQWHIHVLEHMCCTERLCLNSIHIPLSHILTILHLSISSAADLPPNMQHLYC
jgi:hypothetical protein